MAASKKKYDGPDRRALPISDRRFPGSINCYEHSGLVQRICNIENRTDHLENEGFLTGTSFRWIIGILISIVVAVVSASFFLAFETGKTLREVKASQITLSVQIGFLQDDIEEMKKGR